jgi:hypothetical protein
MNDKKRTRHVRVPRKAVDEVIERHRAIGAAMAACRDCPAEDYQRRRDVLHGLLCEFYGYVGAVFGVEPS